MGGGAAAGVAVAGAADQAPGGGVGLNELLLGRPRADETLDEFIGDKLVAA